MSNFTIETTAAEVAASLTPNIAGKVILITGCSPKSLGATAALEIALHKPALIILAGRTESLIKESERALLDQAPDVKTRLLIFDLTSLKSVRDAAAEVNQYPEQVDILINNAGIMICPYEKTVDGYESQFGVNHLGPFLFTNLVVGKIPSGGRIVNVASNAYVAGGVRFNDPNFEIGPYDKWQSYGQSKTANILFSIALAERLESKGIFSFSLHVGGGIFTNLGKHLVPEDFVFIEKLFPDNKMISHEQGASSYIAAAFDPSLEASNGAYLEYCKPVATREDCPWSRGKENADRLWALSQDLVGETFDI